MTNDEIDARMKARVPDWFKIASQSPEVRDVVRASLRLAARYADEMSLGYREIAESDVVTMDGKLLHEGMWAGAANVGTHLRNVAGDE